MLDRQVMLSGRSRLNNRHAHFIVHLVLLAANLKLKDLLTEELTTHMRCHMPLQMLEGSQHTDRWKAMDSFIERQAGWLAGRQTNRPSELKSELQTPSME